MQQQLIKLSGLRREHGRFAECRLRLCQCIGIGATGTHRPHQRGGNGLFGHDEADTKGERPIDRNAPFQDAFARRFAARHTGPYCIDFPAAADPADIRRFSAGGRIVFGDVHGIGLGVCQHHA